MTEPSSNYEKVKQFHEIFGHPAPTRPTLPDDALWDLRRNLIQEEFGEIQVAIADRDLVAFADGVADLLYVVYGLGIVAGLPVDQLVAAVHASNMSKLGEDGKPIYRGDGKILKGFNYEPPTANIKEILRRRFFVAQTQQKINDIVDLIRGGKEMVLAPEDNQDKAKRLVMAVREWVGAEKAQPYVVWFSYTLGNWKALLSTPVDMHLYYEVTYDMHKKEAYVDTYRRTDNVAIPDEE